MIVPVLEQFLPIQQCSIKYNSNTSKLIHQFSQWLFSFCLPFTYYELQLSYSLNSLMECSKITDNIIKIIRLAQLMGFHWKKMVTSKNNKYFNQRNLMYQTLALRFICLVQVVKPTISKYNNKKITQTDFHQIYCMYVCIFNYLQPFNIEIYIQRIR